MAEAGGVEATGEEDCSPEFTPVVQLKEVEVVRSDADEEIVWEKCVKWRKGFVRGVSVQQVQVVSL